MAIKIRRGLEADRTSVIFEEGEVLYTTDTKSFFIGDGVTAGGNQIGGTTAAELLKTEVHNATGSTLTAGQVVYLSGNTGNKPNAVLAQADSEATSSKTIGLIILNIANNANGDIATDGLLSDLNTSMFAPGDLLWLSDSIAGGLTTVAPDTPNNAVFIGYVVAAHPTQGKILIHIQNGYELNELHDVKITSVANGDGLIYDSTLGYWKNSAKFTTQGNTFNAANKLVQLDATAKLPAVDGSQLTNLPSFTPPNGLLKIASAISTTLQTVTDYLGNLSVLQLNSRRVGLLSDSSVTTQTSAVIEAQTTNASLVLKPNGTGAILANIPDGTATGGSARGSYAVDLQLARNSAAQVASGIASFIGGGLDNRALSNYTTITGGTGNTTSSNYSVVLGGQSNTASTNTHATVVGGQSNTSSGQHSISGGLSANASGNKSIALGQQAVASGSNSVALGGEAGGGSGTTASGQRSFAVTYAAYATNQGAIAIGNETIASGIFSMALGNKPAARYYGKLAYANGAGGQCGKVISKRSGIVLNASALGELFVDNISQKYQFLAGVDVTMSFTIDWVAKVTAVGSGTLSVGDAICGKDFFLLKSISQNNTIGTITRISTSSDASMSTSTMTYSVNSGSVNGFLTLNFNAPATANATTFHIVANIETVEIGLN